MSYLVFVDIKRQTYKNLRARLLTYHMSVIETDGRPRRIEVWKARGRFKVKVSHELVPILPNLKSVLLEAGSVDLWVAFPGDTVRDAMSRMFQANVGRLPVVDPDHPTRLVGYLSRGNILAAHQRQMQDEQEIEQGWVRRPSQNRSGKGAGAKQPIK